MSETFAAVINCMDGRVQRPISDYLLERFGVTWLDTITEPGPVGILARHDDETLVQSILQRLDIAVRVHGVKQIGIVAHYDCAGNPVPRRQQFQQLQVSTRIIQSRFPKCEVLPLWVDASWKVHPLEECCFNSLIEVDLNAVNKTSTNTAGLPADNAEKCSFCEKNRTP